MFSKLRNPVATKFGSRVRARKNLLGGDWGKHWEALGKLKSINYFSRVAYSQAILGASSNS